MQKIIETKFTDKGLVDDKSTKCDEFTPHNRQEYRAAIDDFARDCFRHGFVSQRQRKGSKPGISAVFEFIRNSENSSLQTIFNEAFIHEPSRGSFQKVHEETEYLGPHGSDTYNPSIRDPLVRRYVSRLVKISERCFPEITFTNTHVEAARVVATEVNDPIGDIRVDLLAQLLLVIEYAETLKSRDDRSPAINSEETWESYFDFAPFAYGTTRYVEAIKERRVAPLLLPSTVVERVEGRWMMLSPVLADASRQLGLSYSKVSKVGNPEERSENGLYSFKFEFAPYVDEEQLTPFNSDSIGACNWSEVIEKALDPQFVEVDGQQYEIHYFHSIDKSDEDRVLEDLEYHIDALKTGFDSRWHLKYRTQWMQPQRIDLTEGGD